MEHVRSCTEEWETQPKNRCAKLVESSSKRLGAIIYAKKCFNKVLSTGCDVHVIFSLFLMKLQKCQTNFFPVVSSFLDRGPQECTSIRRNIMTTDR